MQGLSSPPRTDAAARARRLRWTATTDEAGDEGDRRDDRHVAQASPRGPGA
jgi:hypothetical protein